MGPLLWVDRDEGAILGCERVQVIGVRSVH